MTRVILYCCQSRTEGAKESLSLDAQEWDLRDHAARQGWHVVVAVRDADLQGWRVQDERPGLAEVPEGCAAATGSRTQVTPPFGRCLRPSPNSSPEPSRSTLAPPCWPGHDAA